MRSITGLRTALAVVALGVASLAACSAATRPDSEPAATVPPGSPAKAGAQVAPKPAVSAHDQKAWDEIDQLVAKQKYEEAAGKVRERNEAARKAGDEEELTLALIKETQLRAGLHGYEKAVRLLVDQQWPEGELWRTVLDLYFARQLMTYSQVYRWEISQREKVASKEKADLAHMTLEEISAEAQRAHQEAWELRDRLGDTPIDRLKAFIDPNDYPREVRGTLRDALSYMRVEILADSSTWRPDQLNEIYRLDLPALIAGNAAASAKVSLVDPEVHPLSKIGAILDDLERWHAAAGRPEAELEARLARARLLHSALPSPEDKRAVAKDLEARLPKYESHPWWSMGMAELARFAQARDEPDSLVKAREIALAGEKRHPGSPGAQHCRLIVASIEAPSYQLSSMLSDGPRKRSIAVDHKNLGALWMRAYAFDLEKQIASSKDYRLLPDPEQIRQAVEGGKPAVSWKAELPGTPDYRTHRTFVTPPLEKPGAYLIVGSAREDFAQDGNQISGATFIVTSLALVSRNDPRSFEVTVLEGASGEPVPGAAVVVYRRDWRDGNKPVQTATTDKEGRASFKIPEKGSFSHFVLARRGSDLTIDPDHLYPASEYADGSRRASLVYTDRSIYRPSQKVLWKVVGYEGNFKDARYRTLPRTTLTVSLVDANNQVVATRKVTTNDFGSAAGELTIPAGRALGSWAITSSLNGRATIRVEEYKRPTFEVSLGEPKSPLRLNREAKLSGEARYYFGLPVTTGTARWRVTRKPVFRDCWWHSPNVQTQVIASGTASLEADGTFDLAFTPAADERSAAAKDEVTFRYQVDVDVVDEGGETRSSSKAFRLGFVSVEAQIASEDSFFTDSEQPQLRVVRADLDGNPQPGNGAWKLLELVQPDRAVSPAELPIARRPGDDSFVTPGDLARPRHEPGYSPTASLQGWKDGAQKASGALEHDAKGVAELQLPALRPGAYRLRYETTDAFGARFSTARELIVAGKETPLALPELLLVKKGSVEVGGKAVVLAHSGLKDQPMVLEIFQNGRRISSRPLRAGTGSLIEIPVSEKDRGGFALRLSTVTDWQLVSLDQQVMVPWDDRALSVELETFRDRLRPGTTETWRVRVKGAKGAVLEKKTAELLAYMYDRSLDLFASHTPFDPLALYPTRAFPGQLRASLRPTEVLWVSGNGLSHLPAAPSFSPDRLIVEDGYAIGGMGSRNGRGRYHTLGGMPGAKMMRPPPAPSAGPRRAESALELDGDASVAPALAETAAAAPASAEPTAPAAVLRTNFAETAFWQPQLLLAPDGSATIELKVPDSVTSWKLWIHALTRDLKAGSAQREARTVKELMVRPYLPRFFREGDEASLKVVVNNAAETAIDGTVDLDIVDPESGKSIRGQYGVTDAQARQHFSAAAGGSANVSVPLRVPRGVGQVAFRVSATSGAFSDGELRPVPILPSRVQLAQSRFVTLKDKSRRALTFEDLAAGGDPTRIDDALVVTVDGQLFYSVLSALPYLVRYPYECTEQTLNRFVSTGIVSSLYDRYPAISRMAKEMSARDTALETFDSADPNRKLALEESPWLQEAKGGRTDDLINVLDPKIARAERESALAKLRKAQTANGGFPWWSGGPPSPFMTLYLMHGFAKAAEFGVEIPRDMVQRGWSYLAEHFRREHAERLTSTDHGWEFLTFLNYTASCYPDDSYTEGGLTPAERKQILEFSFAHWKQHSPYLKAQLALTLKRMGRPDDARMVFDSVMDSAKTTEDEGTFWAPEDRAWLWYNDTIESHAFALRTLSELEPKDSRRAGLVHWLLLNKKLNHWKSTRATAEVVYSLAWYLKAENQLAVREHADVLIGPRKTSFVFEPDRYTGKKNQIVVPGAEIDPKTMSSIVVDKDSPGLMFASATWHFSTETPPKEERGDLLWISRKYFKRSQSGRQAILEPLAEGQSLKPGDEVEVQVSIKARHPAEYVHLRDPRAAGFEPTSNVSGYRWDLGVSYYQEVRDSSTNFFFEQLPQGEYTFKYRLRAAMAGTFKVGPATIQSMYAPEFVAYSAGATLSILP